MGVDMITKGMEKSMFEYAMNADIERLVDQRHQPWVRHKCSMILMMLLVGLLQGRTTIRGIDRLFHDEATAHQMWDCFEPYFGEELRENGFPSCSCVTRFLQKADTDALAVYLCGWSYQLTDDDGVTLRAWGVDGQAVKASKLVWEGGRPKYNVDYFDLTDAVLVFIASVNSKSQEAVVAADTVQDALSGHPNVVLGGDAMMTKKNVLEGAQGMGAKTFMPFKKNNRFLMKCFSETIETLTLEGSPAVGHYVDLEGMPDGIGCEIIRDTICTYEEEDNKKYDADLEAHPIEEVTFFDNVYPYGRESTQDGQGPVYQSSHLPLCQEGETKGVWFKVGNRFIVLFPSHGRYERREYELILDPASCDIWKDIPEKKKREWESLTVTIGMVTRYRAVQDLIEVGEGKNKIKKQIYRITVTRTVYGFSFVPESTEAAAKLIRSYWGIEGNLHKVVDEHLKQDACTCRVGNSTGNMSLLKKIAFNVLSGAKNAVMKHVGKDIGYIDILEVLEKRLDHVRHLLFDTPTCAFRDFATLYAKAD